MVALVPGNRTVTVATPVASIGVEARVRFPDLKEMFPVGGVEAADPVERITEMRVIC
jgi:hypothetical protein